MRVTYPFWVGVLLFRFAIFRAAPSVPIGVIGLTLALLLMAPIESSIYNGLLVLLVLPAIIAFGASAKIGRLTLRVCAAFGRISYPLYLVHWPIFRMLHGMAETSHRSLSPWTLMFCGCAVSIMVAELALLTFDTPVRRWLGDRLAPPDRLEAAATA